MTQEKRFLGVVGSYRKGGVIDTVVSEILDEAARHGAITNKIYLADRDIRFCTNCRACTQCEGQQRVPCVVHTDDDMNDVIANIEQSDTIILGAPVNIGSANALTQRFVERCVGAFYFPWGARYPVLRDKTVQRNAILVSGSAAPSFMNNGFFGSALPTLQAIAELVGAEVVDTIKVGSVVSENFKVPDSCLRKARRTAELLAA